MFRFAIVFALSLVPSIGGILYAAFISGCKDDAQRGGAIGTALALGFSFLSRGYGMRLFALVQAIDSLQRKTTRSADQKDVDSPTLTLAELAAIVETLAAAIVMDGKEQKTLAICLAIATFISTLTWGFGDKLVLLFPRP